MVWFVKRERYGSLATGAVNVVIVGNLFLGFAACSRTDATRYGTPPEPVTVNVKHTYPLGTRGMVYLDPMTASISGMMMGEDIREARLERQVEPYQRYMYVEGERFWTEGLPAGTYDLWIRCGNSFAPYHQTIEVTMGQRIESVDIGKRIPYRIKIMRPDGKTPYSGRLDLSVSIVFANNQIYSYSERRKVNADEFLKGAINAGKKILMTVITPDSGGVIDKLVYDNSQDERIDREIQLEPWPRISGKAVNVSGAGVPGVTVSFIIPTQAPYNVRGDESEAYCMTGPDGEFQINVPPIQFQVTLVFRYLYEGYNEPVETTIYDLQKDSTDIVAVIPEKRAKLKLKVVTQDGAVIDDLGFRVKLRSIERGSSYGSNTGDFSDIEPDRYRIEVQEA